MKTVAIIGKFMPMTKGHLGMIEHYSKKYQDDKVYVFVCYTEGETFPIDIRYSWVKRATEHLPNVEVKYVLEQLGSSTDGRTSVKSVSKVWAKWLKRVYPEITHFGGSEPYVQMMAESVGIEHDIFDIERVNVPISATKVRTNVHKYKDMLAIPEMFDEYVFKFAVVGLDSCGKSSLIHWLSTQFDCEVVHEYGRDYCSIHTPANDGTDNFLNDTFRGRRSLEDIGYGHHKLVIASYRNAWKKKKKILLVDTEHYVTRGFYQRYFDEDSHYLRDLCNFQHYDGYIFCDLLPLEDDGTRRQATDDERKINSDNLYKMIKDNVKDSKIITVPSDYEERRSKAKAFIESVVNGTEL